MNFITVAGQKGRTIHAAVEDVRFATSDTDIMSLIREAIDECQQSIELVLDTACGDDEVPPTDYETDPDFDGIGTVGTESGIQPDEPHEQSKPDSDSIVDAVTYLPASGGHSMSLRQRQPIVYSAGIELQPGTELDSNAQEDLQKYSDRFGGKDFMLHQAQGLPTYITENAYKQEEDNFLTHVTKVHRSKFPTGANVIGSHTLYKIKTLDDQSGICKASIAPHGNHDSQKEELKKDSASCPPVCFRILLSISTILKWVI